MTRVAILRKKRKTTWHVGAQSFPNHSQKPPTLQRGLSCLVLPHLTLKLESFSVKYVQTPHQGARFLSVGTDEEMSVRSGLCLCAKSSIRSTPVFLVTRSFLSASVRCASFDAMHWRRKLFAKVGSLLFQPLFVSLLPNGLSL